jgi:hypothetical protein
MHGTAELKILKEPDIFEFNGAFLVSCEAFTRSSDEQKVYYLHHDGDWRLMAIDGDSTAYFASRRVAENALKEACSRVDLGILVVAGQVALSRLEKQGHRGSRNPDWRVRVRR